MLKWELTPKHSAKSKKLAGHQRTRAFRVHFREISQRQKVGILGGFQGLLVGWGNGKGVLVYHGTEFYLPEDKSSMRRGCR